MGPRDLVTANLCTNRGGTALALDKCTRMTLAADAAARNRNLASRAHGNRPALRRNRYEHLAFYCVPFVESGASVTRTRRERTAVDLLCVAYRAGSLNDALRPWVDMGCSIQLRGRSHPSAPPTSRGSRCAVRWQAFSSARCPLPYIDQTLRASLASAAGLPSTIVREAPGSEAFSRPRHSGA
jgi:hypothetical protein